MNLLFLLPLVSPRARARNSDDGLVHRRHHPIAIAHGSVEMSWLPGYCESASIYGATCESAASVGEGAAAKGSWQLGSTRDCIVRCSACPQCAFVSYSRTEEDCSWFASCNTSRLSQGATKHRTLRVRDLDGNIVMRAQERQRRVRSDAELLEDLAHGFWQPRSKGRGAGKSRSNSVSGGGGESGGGVSGGDPRWVPSSGAELLPVTAATLARCHPRGRWLHVAGDSTQRASSMRRCSPCSTLTCPTRTTAPLPLTSAALDTLAGRAAALALIGGRARAAATVCLPGASTTTQQAAAGA